MNIVGKYTSIQNTKRSDKTNEDFCICDNVNGVYILLDGVSRDTINGKYPNPSPARSVSEIFAHKVHSYLLSVMHNSNDFISIITDAIAHGNESVLEFNTKDQYSFLPGTVGIIVLIHNDTISYGFIGDCFGRLVSKNSVYIFTRCQTEYVHKHISEYTTYEVRNIICNNISHPAGYGVINGEKEAMNFLETGEFKLSIGQKLVLSSDGVEDYINKLTPLELYNITLEQADTFLRNYNSENADDRTLMTITLKD